MSQKWGTATTVAVPSWRTEFHCVEGWRWNRMALFLNFGRNAPGWMDDDEIDIIINDQWEKNPPPFKIDR